MSAEQSIDRSHKDVTELQTLKHLYGRTVDDIVAGQAANPDSLLESIFTDEVIADFRSLPGGMRLEGRGAVFAFYKESMPAGARWTWHGFANPVIRVDGDRATADWLLHAFSLAPQHDAQIMMTIGRYRDGYIRTIDGWRQNRLDFLFGFQAPVAATAMDAALAFSAPDHRRGPA